RQEIIHLAVHRRRFNIDFVRARCLVCVASGTPWNQSWKRTPGYHPSRPIRRKIPAAHAGFTAHVAAVRPRILDNEPGGYSPRLFHFNLWDAHFPERADGGSVRIASDLHYPSLPHPSYARPWLCPNRVRVCVQSTSQNTRFVSSDLGVIHRGGDDQ